MRTCTFLEWISTDVENPDDDSTVLLALETEEVVAGFLNTGVWRDTNAERIRGEVTHWADMPEAPARRKQ